MNDECSDIKAEAHAAGDKHYEAMTGYAIAPTPERRRRALNLALRYRQALNWLIDCYRRLRPKKTASSHLANATEYKHLVDHDIEILSTSKPMTETES
jgi:hypothetical protein